jgi:hypothetical protein
MNTPQPSVVAARIIEVLRSLSGIHTKVTLKDGRELSVHNIAWGRDMADPEYHITTNISPTPQLPHVIDVFSTSDVASIADPQTGKLHFDRLPSNTSLERTRDR